MDGWKRILSFWEGNFSLSKLSNFRSVHQTSSEETLICSFQAFRTGSAGWKETSERSVQRFGSGRDGGDLQGMTDDWQAYQREKGTEENQHKRLKFLIFV